MLWILVPSSLNVVWLLHTLKNDPQYNLEESEVFSRAKISIFFVGQVSRLEENVNIGIYSDTINVINVKLCVWIQLTELYLFMPPSMTLTIFQGHSNLEQF